MKKKKRTTYEDVKKLCMDGKLEPAALHLQITTLQDDVDEKLMKIEEKQDKRETRWNNKFDEHIEEEKKVKETLQELNHNIKSLSLIIEALSKNKDSLEIDNKEFQKKMPYFVKNSEEIKEISREIKDFRKSLYTVETTQASLKNTLKYIISIFTLFAGSVISVIIKKVLN